MACAAAADGLRGDVTGGLGLRGLKARLAMLGGGLEVESAPTEGTVLVAQVPIAAAWPDPDGRWERHEPADPGAGRRRPPRRAGRASRGCSPAHPDFEVVGEACDGEEALSQVEALNPDVVLMDLRMPTLDGVEATERIRAKHPGVQVLVLTTYDTDEDIVRAVEAGAVGYLLKDSPREELFRGVHAAARGESLLAGAVVSRSWAGCGRQPVSRSAPGSWRC